VSASPWCIGKIFAIARQNRAKNSNNNNWRGGIRISGSRDLGTQELERQQRESALGIGYGHHVQWLLLAHNVGYWLRLTVTSLVNRICCGRWQ